MPTGEVSKLTMSHTLSPHLQHSDGSASTFRMMSASARHTTRGVHWLLGRNNMQNRMALSAGEEVHRVTKGLKQTAHWIGHHHKVKNLVSFGCHRTKIPVVL